MIGLNLCPFAAVPFRKDQIRYVVSETDDPGTLMSDFLQEINRLLDTSAKEITTTLLIHPGVLKNFADYLDFAAEAEAILEETGTDGIIQIATFHPDYCFDDAPIDDPANYTNRSPYPMLHLLREESISEALEHYPNTEEIPERNIALLRKMGVEKIRLRQEELGNRLESE